MSHFAVAVITMDFPSESSLNKILAPYDEGTENHAFLEFVDVEDEYRSEYENEGTEMAKMPDGRLLHTTDEAFRVDGTPGVFSANSFKVPDNIETAKVPFKEIYGTFEEFMRDYAGYELEDGATRYGYYHNPNAKWDWYEIGGRFSGSIKDRQGRACDIAFMGDVDTSVDEEAREKALEAWGKFEKGEKTGLFDLDWWKREYVLGMFKDAEFFARTQSEFWFRAVVTPDGKWHEVGEMLMSGCSEENGDDLREWVDSYRERFVKPYLDCYIAIVDCHI